MTSESMPEEEIGLPVEDGDTFEVPDSDNILGLSLEEEEEEEGDPQGHLDDEPGGDEPGFSCDEPCESSVGALDGFGEEPGLEAAGPAPAASSVSAVDDGLDLDRVAGRLQKLEEMLGAIARDFDTKLKYDQHKEAIIDKLHQELQEYKQDLLKKLVLSFVLDTIKLADDIRKWIAHFKSLDAEKRDPMKLFRYLEAIPSDLEDIFYWQGVKPFSTSEGDFDPVRQRALKKIPTAETERNKTIAYTIRPGYEWEGKVIRQEMVAVYMYSDNAQAS